jgi:hypothetical protein
LNEVEVKSQKPKAKGQKPNVEKVEDSRIKKQLNGLNYDKLPRCGGFEFWIFRFEDYLFFMICSLYL